LLGTVGEVAGVGDSVAAAGLLGAVDEATGVEAAAVVAAAGLRTADGDATEPQAARVSPKRKVLADMRKRLRITPGIVVASEGSLLQ
jgi:hypothetical protein